MSNKRKKLPVLAFPNTYEWQTKWLAHSILATPKWQINSLEGAVQFNNWITILEGKLNGLQLPARTDPETNWIRSAVVGVAVSEASQTYENTKVKLPLADRANFLKQILSEPLVQPLVATLTQSPMTKAFAQEVPPANMKPMPSRQAIASVIPA